ncbi:MAG: SGNH/GDSL hydrolase family protein [Phycisphaerae bacterium]|nr:SGNH/GDSL hydrolase family protein [Phycisphaerae bacterium]
MKTALCAVLSIGTLSPVICPAETGAGQPSVVPPVGGSDFNRYVAEGRDSPFGLDYVFALDREFRKPELVRQLGGFVGVRWANFSRINWGDLEPNAPKDGRHAYSWTALDEAVRQWQQYGVHIMMSLRFVSQWANAKPSGEQFTYLGGMLAAIPRGAGDYVPKPEHRQDLREFVQALVERYDGDGVDDMRGLLFPILHYQVCNEAYNELFWAGTVEEYGAHLKEVAQAARQASKDVKIILAGICFNHLDGFYDKEMDARTRNYVQGQLPKVASRMRPFLDRADKFSHDSVKLPDYDILDARWSYYGVVARCQEELRRAGRATVPIWSAEIYTAHPLLDAMILPMTTLHPYPTPSRSLDYIRILRDPRDKQFKEVNRWYRGMQAAMVVKCCMVGLNAGARKLMNGWVLDAQAPLIPYPLHVGGYKSRTLNQLWPAAFTYKQLIEKLQGITACRRMPTPDYIYAYQCTVQGGRRVLVAFYDDHIARNHDQETGSGTAILPVGADRVRVTHSITGVDQTEPDVQILASPGGRLAIRLTPFPVFIEPLAETP